jgi:hypothetical protein
MLYLQSAIRNDDAIVYVHKYDQSFLHKNARINERWYEFPACNRGVHKSKKI